MSKEKNDFSLLDSNKRNKILLEAVQGNQFEHEVLAIQCTVDEMLRVMCIDEDIQRECDEMKVAAISKYIQGGIKKGAIYFAPLIFSARRNGEYEDNKFSLEMKNGLMVLDGQHRIMGFSSVREKLLTLIDKDPDDIELKEMYEKLMNFPVSIKIYRYLSKKQERQLFTDINTKASAVSNTLLIMYKENDLYAKIVREIIFEEKYIKQENFEVRARSTRKKMMTAATLYQIVKVLNEGKYLQKHSSKIGDEDYERYKKNVEAFLRELTNYFNIEKYRNRNEFILYMPAVLIGIAMYIYKIRELNGDIKIKSIFEETLISIDWTHNNLDFNKLANRINKKTGTYIFTSSTGLGSGICKYLLEQSNKGEQCKWEI